VQQLLVFDSLRPARVEWILGVAHPRFERPITYNSNGSTQPRMGVATMSSVSDDIHEYRSTLFKTSSSVKESYLQLLYSQRNKWPKYVLDSLTALLQACLVDLARGGWLYHYLYTLEPPTYCQARYLDWVRPFLAEHIDTCLRDQTILSN